ncbi:PAAR domain-containing protein [Burkholderia sp. MR1-5-21]
MVRQVIVVGDALTPHGGFVATGSNADIVEGKPVARKGDTVECNEPGTQTISEGDESGMVGGSPVALHGHRATCGCTLESRGKTITMS